MTPLATAQHVCAARDPKRAAIGLSVDAIVAMARELVALDDLAEDTFALLQQSDWLAALKVAHAARSEREAAAADISFLIDKIAEALVALGYDNKEPDHGEETQGEHAEPAGAADRSAGG